MISRADISKAAEELARKSEGEIELETAITWGARAIVAYDLALQTGSVRWLLFAEHLYHEALEHGSLVGDAGVTVSRLVNEISISRGAAHQRLA